MVNKEGQTAAFFCVPDITGFTKFIATTDIEFSTEVIPALLRKLIEANILNMQVAEIEGDAVFFYKNGRLPAVHRVAEQCKHLYQAFSDFLDNLEKSDPENYDRYLSNNQLGLKIIIHYGNVSLTNIKGRVKLLGEDVIVAHKLLKNGIAEPNYILLTEKYLAKVRNRENLDQWFHWEELQHGSEQYDYIGEISYRYITLDEMPFMTNMELGKLMKIKKIV